MKRFRLFAISNNLLWITLFFATFTSMTAVAQDSVRGTFQLTDQVQWGKAVLSPGSYTLTIDSTQLPVRGVIRSVDRKIAVVVAAGAVEDLTSQNGFIRLTGVGSERRVRSVNFPLLGVTLVYESLSDKEKEEIARTEVPLNMGTPGQTVAATR